MDIKYQYCSPEIWGGLECTINRVNDQYFDQLDFAKHYERSDDIGLFAGLGIKSLRLPLLWEHHEGEQGCRIDWTWTAMRLERLRSYNIKPIAGLVHHGCGPAFTNLDDPTFPEKLASYAAQVAQRFPDIDCYTPINEPLTTARFSGLYGFWYPHKKTDAAFLRMLLNQLKGTVLSMAEIRKVNPAAQLIQTEDLAKVHSTPLLNYQAEFENHRRWLTYDILCGKLDSHHPLWSYFIGNEIPEEELQFFIDNPCVPDTAGFNYYLTSERFLDDDLSKYPAHLWGGNGRHSYVDTEAVRIAHDGAGGLKTLLLEAWQRYQIPLALTEVHLNCTREEQMRWFKYCHDTAVALSLEGVRMRAITAWAMLGAFGWNRLLTSEQGEYEPGVFDLRSSTPRPTALAPMISELAQTGTFRHPVLEQPGWWERGGRFHASDSPVGFISQSNDASPLIIIGKNGTLGKAFARACDARGIKYRLVGRDELDIANISMIESAISTMKPWAIVNAAGYVRVDEAESDKDKCFRENTDGPHHLAMACRKYGIRLVSFSSDLVFDGLKQSPYVESDGTNPLNVYGLSKATKEQLVLTEYEDALVIRTSAFFSPYDPYNFVTIALDTLLSGESFTAVGDVSISPTYVPDLVDASLDLLIDGEKGVWHLANQGSITWSDLATEVAARAGLHHARIDTRSLLSMRWPAQRPNYSVLNSERGALLPSLDHALSRYFNCRPQHLLGMAV